jgi:hypothetical protein
MRTPFSVENFHLKLMKMLSMFQFNYITSSLTRRAERRKCKLINKLPFSSGTRTTDTEGRRRKILGEEEEENIPQDTFHFLFIFFRAPAVCGQQNKRESCEDEDKGKESEKAIRKLHFVNKTEIGEKLSLS